MVNISKLRQAIPQCCAISARNLLIFTFGTTMGFPTILLPALNGEDSDIKINTEELTWIGSLNLWFGAIGSLMSGSISHYLGRKRTMMITNIPFVIAWLIFYYSSNPAMLFAALIIIGLAAGFLESPVLSYAAEVTQPNLRGMLSATSTMLLTLGIFSQMLSGRLAHWRTVAMINLIYPIICFIALTLMPESPYWLAAKGRFQESERALCWLRGWTSPSQVQDEFQTICETVRKSTENASSDKKKVWRSYTKRTFYVPFILVFVLFLTLTFGGVGTVQTFAVIIFEKLEAPIEKYTATVFLGVAQLTGTLMCVVVNHFLGRRKPSFISICGTGLCFLAVAIYCYLNEANYLDKVRYTWIPTTLIIGIAFVMNVGHRTLPWILIGEIYPFEIRTGAIAASIAMAYILCAFANKIFLYMMNGISLSGTFLFYSLVNFAGLYFLYIMLPETENKTLEEIGEHFAGVTNLNQPREEAARRNVIKGKWAIANPAIVHDENIETRL